MIQLNFYLDFTIHSTVQSTGVNITLKCAVSFNVRGNDHCNLQYTLLYTSHVHYTLMYINVPLTNLHCLVHCTNTLFCTVHYSPVFCTLHCMLTVHCTALCWLLSRQERPSSHLSIRIGFNEALCLSGRMPGSSCCSNVDVKYHKSWSIKPWFKGSISLSSMRFKDQCLNLVQRFV